MRPTALKRRVTVSASAPVALAPRHSAAAVAPTMQGVLGITRTARPTPREAASMSASVTPAAMDTMRWRSLSTGATSASSGLTPYGLTHTKSTSERDTTCAPCGGGAC